MPSRTLISFCLARLLSLPRAVPQGVPMAMLVALTVIAPCLPGQQPALRAGLASVDITPSTLDQMYGYTNRKCGPASGVHDPLYAKVLYLEAGDARMAIVTMDLGSMESRTLFGRVAEELQIPLLLLAPSHTHSAPRFLPPSSSDDPPTPYLAELESKVFTAIQQAKGDTFPATLGVGDGWMQLGYNRLTLRPDGRARAVFDNLQRIPYGPVDSEFKLLQVSDLQGRARALLIHYAAHPVVLGSTSCVYSADYPGVLQARVETAIPGVQAMFVQGAAGCTNPLFQGRTGDNEKDLATMTTMGEILAEAVLASVKTIQPLPESPDAPAAISWRTKTLHFRDRWEPSETMSLGISTVLINGKIALATVPGEPFLEIQTGWKQQADVPHAFFYGYTQTTPDRWPGYIPDIRSAAYGGYGADSSTRIEVGAAERILNEHRIQLYDLKGMWRTKAGPP